MQRLLIVLSAVAMFLSSCGGKTSRVQEAGDTLSLKYATLLTIVRHEGYTTAEIQNPWKKGKVLHSYVLVPRDKELPKGKQHGTIIRTPVERAAVFTTVHCALLNTLGHVDDIVGVADLKYIKIAAVQERVRKGLTADCGGGLNPVVEKIMDIKPEIIMLSPFENAGGYGKLEEINIPLVECAEYMETSPLGRAEWMKFYGLLYGEEQRADSLFGVVDSCYQHLKQVASAAGEGRSVLLDRMVGSVWYVPGGKSTIGQMVKDAGGQYAWSSDGHAGSLALPFETVLERAGDSEVWMFRYSSDHEQNYQELLSEQRGYSELKAFQQHNAYGCNVEQSLFYEESPFRPDYLLSDFIQILHPQQNSSVPLRYYQKLSE